MTVNIYLETNIAPFERKDGMTAYILEAEGMEGRTAADFINVEHATETGATLTGLEAALKRINPKAEVRIWTSCMIVQGAFRLDYLTIWRQRDWTTAKGTRIANEEEWKRVAELLSGRKPEVAPVQQHQYSQWLKTEITRRKQHV